MSSSAKRIKRTSSHCSEQGSASKRTFLQDEAQTLQKVVAEVLQLKEKLEGMEPDELTDDQEEELAESIEALSALPVNLHVLRTTKIGKFFNTKFRRCVKSPRSEVESTIQALVQEWKKRAAAELARADDTADGDLADAPAPSAELQPVAVTTAVRSRAVDLLKSALHDAIRPVAAAEECCSLARRIEVCLHDIRPNDREYRPKLRQLLYNLKKNGDLCERLRRGELSPAQLCELPGEQLANADIQQQNTEIFRRALHRCTREDSSEAFPTSDFRCPDCAKNECLIKYQSVRRDVGKCETWGSKDERAAVAELSCVGCGHKWKTEV